LLAGAVQVRLASALPAVAVTPVGAPGVVYGVTAAEAVEAAPVPSELVATTVNVYAVPAVSPVTMAGLAVTVLVAPPGAAVTTYWGTAEPALSGAVPLAG